MENILEKANSWVDEPTIDQIDRDEVNLLIKNKDLNTDRNVR